jgi:DNA-binding LacI/PurR family transcriptional regulator/signal transduction histidine kinase
MDAPSADREARPRAERGRPPAARGNIGVLLGWFGDAYAMPIIAGISDALRDRGVGVVCFAGGRPRSLQPYEPGARAALDLVGEENVEGLILLAGTLVQMLGPDELALLAARHQELPTVSVAVKVPGCPSVLVDNERGLHDVIAHLAADHGYQRIGFVRGPETSPEAERRFRVYREVMAQHGLGVDPAWIMPGTFDEASGQRAIEILFDERGVSVEALVLANDAMALGAIDALMARGIDVPERVAVVGFDDTERASFATPSLTTVRQPLYKLGRRAAAMLLARIEGQSHQPDLVLPTEPVFRESCGCPLRVTKSMPLRFGTGTLPPLSTSFQRRRPAIVAEITSFFDSPALAPSSWAAPLVDAFADELDGRAHGVFLRTLQQTLRRVADAGEDVWPWQKLVPLLGQWFSPWFAPESVIAVQADELLGQARLVVADVARRAQAQKRIVTERRAHTLSNISQALISALDLRELAAVLADGLPRLEVKSCFLSLYENPKKPTEWSHLVFQLEDTHLGFDGGPANRIARLEEPPVRFRSRRLAPPGKLPENRPFTAVLEPLYFKEEQLGFVLFELGPAEGTFYDELRQQLSSAIMRLLREEELARLHHAEKERSRELEHTYRAMQENQEKLLISEKMAALGRLSAGIAHEMNTPLAAVRTALDELGKLADEYRVSLDDPRVTPADHRDIANDMSSAVRLAASAAEKVAGFVQGIKFQTRDFSGMQKLRFNAIPVIQDTLLLLNHLLRESGCAISFEHPAMPVEIFGLPGRLAQVVTNLVTNAIDASRPKGGGTIVLWLEPKEKEVELRVTDTGTGIAPEIMKRIFDPMFTTKPFGEGTGLGLSIVHDIVSSEFSGTIEVDTRVGEGTTFTLHLASTSA